MAKIQYTSDCERTLIWADLREPLRDSPSTVNPSPESAFSHLYDDSLVSSSGTKPAPLSEPPRLPSEAAACGSLIPSLTGESGCGS